jgi:hypothetical protein
MYQSREGDQDEDDEGEEVGHEDEESDFEPFEDGFGTEGCEEEFAVKKYSLDPRVRFICAVQYRVVVALQEYRYLIDHLNGIEDWVRQITSLRPAIYSLRCR